MSSIRAREAVSTDALQVAIKARTYALLANWLESEDEPVPPEQEARIELTVWYSALDGFLIQTCGEWDRLCGALVVRARYEGGLGRDVGDLLEALDPLTVAAVYWALPPDARDNVWITGSSYFRSLLDQAPGDIPEAVKIVAEFARDPEPPDEIAGEVEASQTEYRKWRAGLPHDLTAEEVATAEQARVESRDLLAACARGETEMRAWFEQHHPGVPLPDDDEEDA